MPRITPAAVEALRNEIQETEWYSLLTFRTLLVLAILFCKFLFLMQDSRGDLDVVTVVNTSS